MLVICPLEELNVTPRSADSHLKQKQFKYTYDALLSDELSVNSLYFSPEVQSILNLSPPQDAELMNTNPSPPVSIFVYIVTYSQIHTHILCLP